MGTVEVGLTDEGEVSNPLTSGQSDWLNPDPHNGYILTCGGGTPLAGTVEVGLTYEGVVCPQVEVVACVQLYPTDPTNKTGQVVHVVMGAAHQLRRRDALSTPLTPRPEPPAENEEECLSYGMLWDLRGLHGGHLPHVKFKKKKNTSRYICYLPFPCPHIIGLMPRVNLFSSKGHVVMSFYEEQGHHQVSPYCI